MTILWSVSRECGMGRTYGILGGKQPRQCAYTSHPWTSNPVLTVQAPSALGPQAPLQSLIRVKQSPTPPMDRVHWGHYSAQMWCPCPH